MSHKFSSYPQYAKRQSVQEKMIRKDKIKGSGFENLSILHSMLHTGLKVLNLKQRGLENVLNCQLLERDLFLPDLDPYWQGKRILHLSDTHLDGIPGLVDVIVKTISDLSYDLCVITGDFRFGKGAYNLASMAPTVEMLQSIKAPLGMFGVLGNHDFIEEVEVLEANGLKILLNESIDLGHNLFLGGVDDPHLYECDDLVAAAKRIPSTANNILLIHSPEKVKEAHAAGFQSYLCGHTHGGQIKLPLLGRPFTNARCKRALAFGEFEYKGMQGYTHNGTGASSVAARFGCPSEIVIHTLKSRPHDT
jgi:uncharacterized protein